MAKKEAAHANALQNLENERVKREQEFDKKVADLNAEI